MQSARSRVLAVDVVLAVAVGVASWTAARFTGRVTDGDGGPFRDGPFRPGPMRHVPMDLGDNDVGIGLLACIAILVAGVALRRAWPRLTFLVVVVAVAGYLALGGPYGPVLFAPALCVHALAAALPVNRWVPLTLALVPMLMAGYWNQAYLGLTDPGLYGALLFGSLIMALPVMVGLLRRNRREAERFEHDQELRRYAYEERLRIARDVHDVVGHSLSVINLQAGVALHVLQKRPDQVEASLEAIKRTSREALAELRTTLEVFRGAPGGEPLAPQPGLDRLDDLVGALRSAGRDVRVVVDGPASEIPLPAAVDQAAYRIIQEALTNVVRHAGTAAATLTITRTDDSVRLQVTDDGPGQQAAEGNGILGMRERARAVGGLLAVTTSPQGGFTVTADLPIAPRVGVV